MPTAAIMQKLIIRAADLKTKYDITYCINPKEKKRLVEEHNHEEPVNETYQKLRILPKKINYPSISKGEEFYE